MDTKFYTEEGNYDLVHNNMGVFFIQDAIKFPDIIHANKPEPHNEIPQATAAHDTFWDFVVNNQETAHQVLWIMSDRGIPRSFRMMESFSINTFRFVNKEGVGHFVRFHWKPLLGVHGLVWDEAQKISGKDPDFHRRDLYEAIENGNFPQWELGVQILKEEEEFNFDFDILDPTKVWPEEEIPVKIIGKMTLNKNVDNFFTETEQVAFNPGHIIPGIDFTNDPLLQGRLFSYLDTQLIRLGGPNFNEIPINRPLVPVHNNQRDGYHRVEMYSNVNLDLATEIAKNLGVSPPQSGNTSSPKTSAALSMENTIKTADTRKLVVILADGFNSDGAKIWISDNDMKGDMGVVIDDGKEQFVEDLTAAIAAHRHWERKIY